MLEILFLPFSLMASVPGGAFLPAGLLAIWVVRRWPRLTRGRRTIAGSTTVLWVAYAIYETRMYYWMKSVVAPIRVDLLLIAPALIIATVAAIIAAGRESRR